MKIGGGGIAVNLGDRAPLVKKVSCLDSHVWTPFSPSDSAHQFGY
jgi:hypothetical protein